jgi:hypothetical protein
VHDAVKYVERLLAAVPDKDSWILLLEDDVWIYNQVPLDQLKFDMCGGHSGLRLSLSVCIGIAQKIKDFPRKNVPYAKTGGAFLRASFMRNMRADDKWRKNVNLLFLLEPKFPAGILLSALIYMEGGTVGPYPGYFEPEFYSFKLFSAIKMFQNKCKILGNQQKKFSLPEP